MAVRYGLEQDASGVPYLVAEGAVGEDEILLDSPTAVKHFLNSDYIRLGHQAEEHVWMLTKRRHTFSLRIAQATF